MKSKQLVIFDIDGTLCDTSAVDEECFLKAAGESLGVEPRLLRDDSAPHVTDAGIIDYLWRKHRGQGPSWTEVTHFSDRYVSFLAKELRQTPERFKPTSGALGLFDRLEAEGWAVAVATGGWSRPTCLKLAGVGLPDGVLLATSDDSYDRVEIFHLAQRRAAERRGGEYTRIVLVGDGVPSLPVTQVSSVTFGGEDLTELYITSAAEAWSSSYAPPGYDFAASNVGGSLYRVRLDIQGRPEHLADLRPR